MRDNLYGEDIEQLDLAKYGLSRLQGKNLFALDDADMQVLLKALGDDDISLNLPLACNADNVRDVLAYSNCRRCGRCCRPNPLNPESPGVEVFEEELRSMADHVGESYDGLKARTSVGSVSPYAFQVVQLGFTRWLLLPCHFYSEAGCGAYAVRPVVCRTYPVIFTGDDTCISIRVTCDYGRELVTATCKRLLLTRPDLEMQL